MTKLKLMNNIKEYVNYIKVDKMYNSLKSRIDILNDLSIEKRIDFIHEYHLVLENIRELYFRMYGTKDITSIHMLELYNRNIDNEFVNLYIYAIRYNGTHDQKMCLVKELFGMIENDYNIIKNTYKVLRKVI